MTAVTIMIVEDDPIDFRVVKRGLDAAHVINPIVHARNGEEALDILRGQHPDHRIEGACLALVDINMPRMNGFEFLEAVMNLPDVPRPAVFMLSSSDMPADVTRAYELGAVGFINKLNAGPDFLRASALVNLYVQIVEIPDGGPK